MVAEKALTGTWLMYEVRMAVKKDIDFFRFTKSINIGRNTIPNWGGHFVKYKNTFLKLKAEARGYPAWVRSPQNEDQYIETFF
jgi:hypothetical protein